MAARVFLGGLVALGALGLGGCVSIDGDYNPPCYRVAQERPELMGRVFCTKPQSRADRAAASARAQSIADMRNAAQQAIRNTRPPKPRSD